MNKAFFLPVVLVSMLMFTIFITVLPDKDMMQMTLFEFTALFNRVYVGITLLILLILILVPNWNINIFSGRTGQFWVAGFGAILVISTLTAYYINPHDRFSIRRYISTTPVARHVKSAYYKELTYGPQIIIMGTSRAFTLSPEYIYQKTGYKAFNFSVEEGKVVDYLWQLNYILDQKIGLPRVLVIEIGYAIPSGLFPDTEAQVTFSRQPLSMLPYFSLAHQKEVLFAYGEDILSVQSFSDSLYVMMHSSWTPEMQDWTFQENGLGKRRLTTHNDYRNNLQSQMAKLKNSSTGYFCLNLEGKGGELLQQLVSNAEEQSIGVVLYQSPVNGTALQNLIMKNDQFYRCQKLLTDFIYNLKSEHKNVWYHDLIDYKPITSMKEDGFYDTIHLRPNASQAVIDQLIPNIQSALQWSETQNNQKSFSQ